MIMNNFLKHPITAKEYIEDYLSLRKDILDEETTEDTDVFDSVGNIEKMMIDYTRSHITKALKAVHEQNEEILSKEIVMNAYPLDLIK